MINWSDGILMSNRLRMIHQMIHSAPYVEEDHVNVSICVSHTSSACFFRVSEGSGAWRKFVRLFLALFLLIFNLKSLKICLKAVLNSSKTQRLNMPVPQRSGMHAAWHAHIHKSSSNAHVRLHYRIIQWIIYWTVAPQRIRIRTTWMRHHSYHSIDLSA